MRRSHDALWTRVAGTRNLPSPAPTKEMDLKRPLRSPAIPRRGRGTVATSGDVVVVAGVVRRTAGAGRVAIAAMLGRSREALSREAVSHEPLIREQVIREPAICERVTREPVSREMMCAPIEANVPDASSHAVVRPRGFSVRRRPAGLGATTITGRLLVISR